MPPSDEYDDLRYDPNWRKNLAQSEFLQTNFSFDSNEDPGDTLTHTGHVSPRRRHEYLVVHSPVSSEIDTVHRKPLVSSFHLHPPEDQDTELSVPQSSLISLESTLRSISNNTKLEHRISNQQSAAGILPFSSPGQRQQAQIQVQHDGQNKRIAQEQNTGGLNGVTVQKRRSHKVRPTRPREDIVERNKATLGMNSQKQGSYLKAYEQRGEKADEANQVGVYWYLIKIIIFIIEFILYFLPGHFIQTSMSLLIMDLMCSMFRKFRKFRRKKNPPGVQ